MEERRRALAAGEGAGGGVRAGIAAAEAAEEGESVGSALLGPRAGDDIAATWLVVRGSQEVVSGDGQSTGAGISSGSGPGVDKRRQRDSCMHRRVLQRRAARQGQ